MKLSILAILTTITAAQAAITWTLDKASDPTDDEKEAYKKIEAAMEKAAARHAELGKASKDIKVFYHPGVPSAEANIGGEVRFGSDRAYMNERVALHEIAHTLGVGQTTQFNKLCKSGDWETALPMLREWDGEDAKISCGGGHFWPYGLNFANEWSNSTANRHVQIINAMIDDGMSRS